MKKASEIIAIFNVAMLGCFVLTMVILGDRPGVAHPLIVLFFMYFLVSPIPAFLGMVLGIPSALKKEGMKAVLFNAVYFIFGLGVLAVLIIGGVGV